MVSTNLCSQNSVIAVQNGGTPQFFYTFQDALSAASSGDTLYLPAGIFAISAAIQKELHFVGRGHYPSESTGSGISRITGNIIIKEGGDGSSFEGIYLDNIFIANGTGANIFITISDLSFIRSSFAGLTTGGQDRDNKFGHGLVFKEVQNMMGDKYVHCEAFPIGLVMPEGQKEDPDAFMKTHLNDDNFKGEIVDIYNAFCLYLMNENI